MARVGLMSAQRRTRCCCCCCCCWTCVQGGQAAAAAVAAAAGPAFRGDKRLGDGSVRQGPWRVIVVVGQAAGRRQRAAGTMESYRCCWTSGWETAAYGRDLPTVCRDEQDAILEFCGGTDGNGVSNDA